MLEDCLFFHFYYAHFDTFWHQIVGDIRTVPNICIRNCADISNNLVPKGVKVSITDVKEKTIFEHLYLVPGLSTFGPWVNWPYAPTTPTVYTPTISRFLCKKFPRMAPQFFLSEWFSGTLSLWQTSLSKGHFRTFTRFQSNPPRRRV